jgi:hypothetical protein
MQASELIQVTAQPPIAVVTINHPDRRVFGRLGSVTGAA